MGIGKLQQAAVRYTNQQSRISEGRKSGQEVQGRPQHRTAAEENMSNSRVLNGSWSIR